MFPLKLAVMTPKTLTQEPDAGGVTTWTRRLLSPKIPPVCLQCFHNNSPELLLLRPLPRAVGSHEVEFSCVGK